MIEYMKVYINNYHVYRTGSHQSFDEVTLNRRFIKQLKKRGLPLSTELTVDKVGDVLFGGIFKVYWADGSPISERQKEIIVDSMHYFWMLDDCYYEIYEFGQSTPSERVNFGYLRGRALVLRHDTLPIGQQHDIESIVSDCKRKMTGSLMGCMRTDRAYETVVYFYGTPYEVIDNAIDQALATYPLRQYCHNSHTGQSVRGYNLRWQ